MSENPVEYKIDNSIAAIWSMMLPGLGQLLKGQVMAGIFWAFFVGFGYFAFFWPGLIFHAVCILDAAISKGENSIVSVNSPQKIILLVCLVIGLLAYIVVRNF